MKETTIDVIFVEDNAAAIEMTVGVRC